MFSTQKNAGLSSFFLQDNRARRKKGSVTILFNIFEKSTKLSFFSDSKSTEASVSFYHF